MHQRPVRCDLLAGRDKRVYLSFPFNVDEIIRRRTVDVEWFAAHPCIAEVYCAPFFMNIEYNDMNGPSDAHPDVSVLRSLHDNGIRVCVTFNDIFHNYPDRTFDEILKYADIIDALVVPDISWRSALGDQFEYRNTVVHIPTFDDVKAGLYDDYNVIYIHDDIIHNHDKWLAIKGDRKFGCVSNFQECVGYCTHKKQHYYMISNGVYSFDADGARGCPAQQCGPLIDLVRCAIPPDYTEYMYYSDVIDIFKLQGRTQSTLFRNAMHVADVIESRASHPSVHHIKVRNCGGDCNRCGWCRRYYEDSIRILDIR